MDVLSPMTTTAPQLYTSQAVDVVALVMNSPSDASNKQPHDEELISQRISKRADRRAEIQAKAESYKRAGDLFYESSNYKAAYSQYLEAIQLLGNVPEYYISLAAAYRKLTWHEEAAHAATRALIIDPTNLEARYIRGVARLEQRLLLAAQTDFETVLEHEPAHLRSMAAIAEVRQFMSQGGIEDISSLHAQNTIVDFGFPHWDYEALEVASVSDSSDCRHVGNGVPCRFYNHDGCGKGTECLYSHSPDEKSVRDNMGKNVCIYHILDSCKFGDSRCVYSHVKDALPERGWWNSPEKIIKVKGVLEVAERNAKDQRQQDIVKWRAYMRGEERARQALEKQKSSVKLEQPLGSKVTEKKPAGNIKKTSVETKTLEAKEKAGEVSLESGQDERPGISPTLAISREKNRARRHKTPTKKVEPEGELQKNADDHGDPTTSAPSVKRTRRRRNAHNRKGKTGTVPAGQSDVGSGGPGETNS